LTVTAIFYNYKYRHSFELNFEIKIKILTTTTEVLHSNLWWRRRYPESVHKEQRSWKTHIHWPAQAPTHFHEQSLSQD